MLCKNIMVLLFVSLVQFSFSLSQLKPYYNLGNSEYLFEQFVLKYNKFYDSRDEHYMRHKYFRHNIKEINFFNSMNKDAVFDINEFSDLSRDEFELMTGFTSKGLPSKNHDAPSCNVFIDGNIVTKFAPPTFDWRDLNKVTRVSNQKKCGSCWAYSVIGNIESQYAILKNTLLELSKQQLVDCTTINDGCNGGDTLNTLRFLMTSGGVELESDYPYVALAQNCSFNPFKAKIRVANCNNYILVDEDKIKEVLFNVGPLSIALDADVLYSYSGGVIDYCPGRDQNHAVLLVGYGTDGDKDFWLVKNSWGPQWGEKGYFRLKRGINACGFVNEKIVSAVL